MTTQLQEYLKIRRRSKERKKNTFSQKRRKSVDGREKLQKSLIHITTGNAEGVTEMRIQES